MRKPSFIEAEWRRTFCPQVQLCVAFMCVCSFSKFNSLIWGTQFVLILKLYWSCTCSIAVIPTQAHWSEINFINRIKKKETTLLHNDAFYFLFLRIKLLPLSHFLHYCVCVEWIAILLHTEDRSIMFQTQTGRTKGHRPPCLVHVRCVPFLIVNKTKKSANPLSTVWAMHPKDIYLTFSPLPFACGWNHEQKNKSNYLPWGFQLAIHVAMVSEQNVYIIWHHDRLRRSRPPSEGKI